MKEKRDREETRGTEGDLDEQKERRRERDPLHKRVNLASLVTVPEAGPVTA